MHRHPPEEMTLNPLETTFQCCQKNPRRTQSSIVRTPVRVLKCSKVVHESMFQSESYPQKIKGVVL